MYTTNFAGLRRSEIKKYLVFWPSNTSEKDSGTLSSAHKHRYSPSFPSEKEIFLQLSSV
jgi:hypothetical protein